jgi:hypothetical protein
MSDRSAEDTQVGRPVCPSSSASSRESSSRRCDRNDALSSDARRPDQRVIRTDRATRGGKEVRDVDAHAHTSKKPLQGQPWPLQDGIPLSLTVQQRQA